MNFVGVQINNIIGIIFLLWGAPGGHRESVGARAPRPRSYAPGQDRSALKLAI